MAEPGDEELRIALVMTGGVSLAVWMGGVATEVGRLAAGDDGYGAIAALTRTVPRVDVVGGTSAGGINGAVLAAGLVHGRGIAEFRDVWIDNGGFELMLRSEADAQPASLLRGDDYFLPLLQRAFASFDGPAADADDVPLELLITTTSLTGGTRRYRDDAGTPIDDVSYRALFRFRRGNGAEVDDFTAPRAAERLALAARCTASLPGAFEPTWCPIGHDEGDRPDMASVASFGRSGFVIDGGVLMNKPLAPVLEAVVRQPAELHARRTLLYVEPAPHTTGVASSTGPPGFGPVVLAGMNIPKAESVARELDSIWRHNQRVQRQRRLLRTLLRRQDGGQSVVAALADCALDDYAQIRAQDIVDGAVADLLTTPSGHVLDAGMAEVTDRLMECAQHVLACPSRLPADVRDWTWTGAELSGMCMVVETLARAALDLPDQATAGRPTLDALKDLAHELHVVQREMRDAWRRAAEHAVGGFPSAPPTPQDRCARVAGALGALVVGHLAETRARCARHLDDDHGVRELAAELLAMLPDPDVVATAEAATRWLLLVTVAATTMSGGPLVADQTIELVQVSADAPNGFDDRRSPDDKLAGLQLQHFGAFYKRSWRANDWMWGRLDVIPRLVATLLSPRRLRALAAIEPGFADTLVPRLYEIAVGSASRADRPRLEAAWDADAVAAEVAFVGDPASPLPTALPVTVLALARRLQLGVLRDELPRVQDALRGDGADGHLVTPVGAEFAAAADLVAADPVAAFARCRIGTERLSDDVDSPMAQRMTDRLTALGLRLATTHTGWRDVSIRRGRPVAAVAAREVVSGRFAAALLGAVFAVAGMLLLVTMWRGVAAHVAVGTGAALAAVGAAIVVVRSSRRTVTGAALVAVVATAVALAALGDALPWRLLVTAAMAVIALAVWRTTRAPATVDREAVEVPRQRLPAEAAVVDAVPHR